MMQRECIMKLIKKFIYIFLLIALLCITNTIIKSDNNKVSMEVEQYIKCYEEIKKSILERIREINERYGNTFREQLRVDVENAIKSNSVKYPEMLMELLKQIEERTANNTKWIENSETNRAYGYCFVTEEFGVFVPNPRVWKAASPDWVNAMITLERYIPEDEGIVKNKIIGDNALRYFYKFFENRISEAELKGIIDQLLADNVNKKFEREINGVNYTIEYVAFVKEIRVAFKWK